MFANKSSGKVLKNELKRIIQGYLSKKATEKEKVFLDRYYGYFDKEPNATDLLTNEQKQLLQEDMRRKIEVNIRPRSMLYAIKQNGRMIAAIAAGVMIVFSVAYIYTNSRPARKLAPVADIMPGSAKAILQLADGTMISLDSNVINQQLARQGEVDISLNDGRVSYKGASDKMLYNTMSTPRGGYYQLTLSDGTKVWLNARSSLHYPVAFNDRERKVSLNGEAYFEVAKNARPFRIAIQEKGEIEVLGTHFNVMAYPEQSMFAATLLEGRVKVIPMVNNQPGTGKARLLLPGQQALVSAGTVAVKRDVDIDAIMAWKSGKFYFEDETLENILHELSLWYDIDIVYRVKEPAKKRRFFMMMNRDVPLSEVLKSLKINDMDFVIEERKLIVK